MLHVTAALYDRTAARVLRMLGNWHLADPAAQVVWVGDRRGHGHQLHVGRAVDDRLLPHAAPVRVAQVVHLRPAEAEPAAETEEASLTWICNTLWTQMS